MSLLFALLPAVMLAPVPKDLEAQIKWRLAKGTCSTWPPRTSRAGR